MAKKAVELGYRARSVFKLQELDEKFKLLEKGMTVLDLGAFPGSWLQYVSEKIGNRGRAFGVDLTEIQPIANNVITIQEDLYNKDAIQKFLNENNIDTVDIVISDLAPKTSGIQDIDQWKSIELSQGVLEIAKDVLRPKGICVMKILQGADFDEFLKETRKTWKLIKSTKVKASRKSSKEIYVILKK
ncbi:MAG: RlmE family RNA methyltransferase [Candidatus Peribacteraceae bacterium]|nr:RlmE family RNA methyltransferase [Candidatus Peribacteraceae bacterium]